MNEEFAVDNRAVWTRLSFRCLTFVAVLCLGAHAAIVATGAETQSLSSVRDRLATGKPVTIVCLGDSVTAIHYHSGGRRAYPELLMEALSRQFPAAKVRVINAGVSGNDTSAGLSRLPQDVLAHHPDLVTVMFGLNDIVNLSPEQFHDNLSKIVDRIQASGCHALVCTPNSIEDTPQRTQRALATYVGVVRQVAKERGVPLADAFKDFDGIRKSGANDFHALFSDPIHPNLDGHKRLSSTIAEAIVGGEVDMGGVKPREPALPHVQKLIASKRPIEVFAMPPYDEWIAPAIAKMQSQSSVHVSSWNVAGKTLKDIAHDAEQVRVKRPDLVIVAIPLATLNSSQDRFARSYCDVLSRSFSYVNQEWDVLALSPSLERQLESSDEQLQDEWSQRLIQAFDLPRVARDARDARPARQQFENWIVEQLSARRD